MRLISFKLLAFFFRHAELKVVFAIVLGVLTGLSSVALMALINFRLSFQGRLSQELVWLFFGLLAVDFVANYLSGLISVRIAQDSSFNMRMSVSRHVIATPLRRLEEIGSHRILAVLTQDVPNINTAFLRLPLLFVNLAIVLGCMIYLGWLSPFMLLTLSLFILLSLISWHVFGWRAQQALEKARANWDDLADHFRAMTDGAKEIKLHRGRRDAFLDGMLHSTTTA